MTNRSYIKDLVVLVADKNCEYAIKGLLSRNRSLGISQIKCDVFIHLYRDPGCYNYGYEFLRPFVNQYSHALVVFDREGCGYDNLPREELEYKVEFDLSRTGWKDRSGAIVIDPELEAWVWSDSTHVETVLGWEGRQPDLRTWLAQKGYMKINSIKPTRPKEAVEETLKKTLKVRSSVIYHQLAERVSLERCIDPSFSKFKSLMRNWFYESGLG